MILYLEETLNSVPLTTVFVRGYMMGGEGRGEERAGNTRMGVGMGNGGWIANIHSLQVIITDEKGL
jgi:hypothetical protein